MQQTQFSNEKQCVVKLGLQFWILHHYHLYLTLLILLSCVTGEFIRHVFI